MKIWQFALSLIVFIGLREVAGIFLIRLTGLAVLANLGGLALSAFFAGWLAGAISKLGPSYGQLWGLAALGVIAGIAIALMQGAGFFALAVIFMLLVHTPISYYSLLLGAYVAERGMKIPPAPPEEDSAGPDHEASEVSRKLP